MFSTIKAYIYGIGAALVAYLVARNKWLASKNEKLKEKNAKHEKLEEITNATEKAQIKAEKVEDEAKAEFDDKDWRDKI